jgi:HipA-like C-terminal domain
VETQQNCGPTPQRPAQNRYKSILLSRTPWRSDLRATIFTIANVNVWRSKPSRTRLSAPGSEALPPLIRLSELLNGAMHIVADGDDDSDLRLILAPGLSLGGGRAKASVLDQPGELSIAKFPQADDANSVMQWEAVAIDLARRVGIVVPTWRLEQVADCTALLLRRFDRDGDIRIPLAYGDVKRIILMLPFLIGYIAGQQPAGGGTTGMACLLGGQVRRIIELLDDDAVPSLPNKT